MQELDVSKPYRDIKDKTELEHVSVIVLNDTKLVLAKSKVDKGEIESLYMRTFEQLENFNPGVPENPAFSWDSPIRFKERSYYYGAKIITKKLEENSQRMGILIEHANKEREWIYYYNKKEAEEYLENYEPEEIVEILPVNSTNNILGISWAVRSKNKYESKTSLGFFHNEEDAELFKGAKEQGL